MSAHFPFFSRLCSRLLALVLALTVLAPGFGWEVAGYANAGTHVLPHASAEAHAGMDAGAHAGHDADCATPDECGGNHHHCCPGHVLGHLPVYPVAALRVPLLTGAQMPILEGAAAFSSRVPQGLERPPRFYAV
ncbi:MAG: hypothetical protein ACK5JI_00255 [Azonexus sp.]